MKTNPFYRMAFAAVLLRAGGACAQVSFPHDLAVTNLYSLDKLAQADAAPHTVRARILNRGLLPVTNAVVRLRMRGANALVRTATLSLAPGQAAVVAFAPYLPGALGRQRLSVRVPADDNSVNDSLALGQVISPDTTSYITPGVANFDAFPTGSPWMLESALGTRFAIGNTPRLVQAVRAYVTDTVAVGQNVVGFVADLVTGRILSRSVPRILTRNDIDRVMTFRLLDDLVIQNQEYLAGFSVLGRTGPAVRRERYPYGYQLEVPYRTRAFYQLWPLVLMNTGDTPPLPPTDQSILTGLPNSPDTLSGKPMIEVITAPPPACARPANLHVVVRGGPFRVAFDSTYNALGYEVAYGPAGFDPDRAAATGGRVVAQRRGPFVLAAALPSTNYNFYVRSQCAGATARSAWVGPVGATSPCRSSGVFQFPYREAFDALPPGQPLPCGTELLDEDNNRSSWEVKSALTFVQPPIALSQSPPNALYLNLVDTEYPAGGAADDWFFTPPLALQAAHRYRLSFNFQNLSSGTTGGNTDRLAVWLGDAPDPARQTQLLYRNAQINTQLYRPANAASTPAVQSIAVTTDGFYYLGFNAFSQHAAGVAPAGYRLLIDDLEVADDGPLLARTATPTPALHLYPNPAADGRFNLEMSSNAGVGTVRVADALGRVVLAAALPATGRLPLNLSQQPAGLYVVQVCTAAGCVARKLVVGLQ